MDTANRRANQKQSPPGAAGANGARPGGSASITHTDLNNFDRWSLDRIEAKAVLPPYSPDLNPIEKMWSKAKTMLRAAKARTADELFEAIGTALDKVTPRDAKGWFRHCGVAMIG